MWLAVYLRARRVGTATHEQADDVPSIVGACQGERSLVALAPRLIDVGASVEEGIGESHRGEVVVPFVQKSCKQSMEIHLSYGGSVAILICDFHREDTFVVLDRGIGT